MTTLLFWSSVSLSTLSAARRLVPYWHARPPFEWVGELGSMIAGWTVGFLVFVLFSSLPAEASTLETIETIDGIVPGLSVSIAWEFAVEFEGGLTRELVDEYRRLNPPEPVPAPRVVRNVRKLPPAPVPPEAIDELLRRYFAEPDLDWARRVSYCESRWDANAVSRTDDHGIFQHHMPYWADRSARAGYPGGNVYDPETNVAVAAWLFYNYGKNHWTCSRKLGL